MPPIRIRPAVAADATRLLELRAAAILQLALPGLPAAQAVQWAARVTLADMERRIRGMDVRVAEMSGAVVGWMALDGDRLEGLYTDPRFVRHGVATELLALAEELVQARGGDVLRAEASRNAEAFYFRRGYVPEGPPLPHGAQPIVKWLAGGVEPSC